MSSLSYISTSKRKQLQEQEKIFWLNLRTLSLWALKTLYSDFFFVNTTPREMRRKNNKQKSISAWMLSKLFLPTQPSLPGHPRSRVLRWEEWKVFLCCLLSSRRIPLIIVDSRVAEDENQTAPRLDNTRKEISRKEANYLFKKLTETCFENMLLVWRIIALKFLTESNWNVNSTGLPWAPMLSLLHPTHSKPAKKEEKF